LHFRAITSMNPNKALWEQGDFTRIAQSMRESGEALVQTFGITPGLKVLDLGCGDGTTALPMASLGADVLGVDIAQNLLKLAAGAPRNMALPIVNSRKAMPATCMRFPTNHLIWWSASSERCLPQSRSMWPRKWCGSRGREVESSWEIGSPAIP